MSWTQDDLERIASRMRKIATHGEFNGRMSQIDSPYFRACTRTVFGTNLIYTRDSGHHTSGWFKNPLYERCLHLSTSPVAAVLWTPDTPDLDRKLRDGWIKAFFGDDVRYVWAESPKSRQGRAAGVWHWRLFCDEHWVPILPIGEVYSLDFTEKGWQSTSELGITIESPLTPG